MWLAQCENAVFSHTALLFDGKRSFIHCLTISCDWGRGAWRRQSQRSRVPKLERHRVGIVLVMNWYRGRGNHCLAVTACRSGGTTSQWLLSCPYYAKTCILEGAWFGVESRTRTRLGRTNWKTPAPSPGRHARCICIIVFEKPCLC